MGFLNSEQLGREIEEGALIKPFCKERIHQGAYELALSGEYYHTAMEQGKETISAGKQVTIPPGQLAILITEETVCIPGNRTCKKYCVS